VTFNVIKTGYAFCTSREDVSTWVAVRKRSVSFTDFQQHVNASRWSPSVVKGYESCLLAVLSLSVAEINTDDWMGSDVYVALWRTVNCCFRETFKVYHCHPQLFSFKALL
jgi:hypothetical protein